MIRKLHQFIRTEYHEGDPSVAVLSFVMVCAVAGITLANMVLLGALLVEGGFPLWSLLTVATVVLTVVFRYTIR